MRLVLDLDIAGDFNKAEKELIHDLLVSNWNWEKGVPIDYKHKNIGYIKIDSYNTKVSTEIDEIKMQGRVIRN